MKKKMMAIAGTLVLLIGASVAFVAAQNNTLDPNSLLAQNIEALGQGEDPGVVRKNCKFLGWIGTSGCYADNYGATCKYHSDCGS